MGNVGKPPDQPAGKARPSDEYRVKTTHTPITKSDRVQKGDPFDAPTGEESQPTLHGGQRPGAPSRLTEAIEQSEALREAHENLLRNKAATRDEREFRSREEKGGKK